MANAEFTGLGVDAESLVAGKHGTVFVAPTGTALPSDLSKFTLEYDGNSTDWKNIGYMPEGDVPSFDKSGGEATSLNTWQQDSVRTTYSPVVVSVSAKVIQANTATLKFVYNGWEVEGSGIAVSASAPARNVAMLILLADTDTGARFGVFFPSASMKFDTLPDFSGDFASFSFTATAQSSATIKNSSTGQYAICTLLPPTAFAPKA